MERRLYLLNASNKSMQLSGSDGQHSNGNCDGLSLKNALLAAGVWLEKHSAIVNALNVFPVPDGDTGTNMVLTMAAALEEVKNMPDNSAGKIAAAFANGALMGARGNSGVILSQLLRGFARSMESKEQFTAADICEGFKMAADMAYMGVIKPVEGTILTVAREASNEALAALSDSPDVPTLWDRIVVAASRAEELTPELLPVLKEAGVVDSGGQGLVYLLEGIARFLHGESVDVDEKMEKAIDLRRVSSGGPLGYGYDVQFLIKGRDLNVPDIRSSIASMGDSALIVGDTQVVKVHIHANDPGIPISYGISQGTLSDIVVENMQEQYKEFVVGGKDNKAHQATEEVTNIATVSVVSGEGLIQIFTSLGASKIVRGGQTMNPSTQELLEAIETAPSQNVLVLPNNRNVILASNQAKSLSKKNVVIIPTKTIPQGISALVAFNYQADLDANAERMAKAAEEIQTIEVTVAVRSTKFDGIEVKEGDIIGLLNDRLTCAGKAYNDVVLEIIQQLQIEKYEIATIYYGDGSSDEDSAVLKTQIIERFPALEVEVLKGGQAYYRYIISVE
jgi:uncharacterized protein